jgi:hypothetical protein
VEVAIHPDSRTAHSLTLSQLTTRSFTDWTDSLLPVHAPALRLRRTRTRLVT